MKRSAKVGGESINGNSDSEDKGNSSLVEDPFRCKNVKGYDALINNEEPYDSSSSRSLCIDENMSECSYDSSPREIFNISASGPFTHTVPIKKEKDRIQDTTSVHNAVQEGTSFETVKLDLNGKREINKCETSICEVVSSTGRKVNLLDLFDRSVTFPKSSLRNGSCSVRARLLISGTKQKKIFTLKPSQIFNLVKRKDHPLHKWVDTITLENMKFLTIPQEILLMQILTECMCVKVVKK